MQGACLKAFCKVVVRHALAAGDMFATEKAVRLPTDCNSSPRRRGGGGLRHLERDRPSLQPRCLPALRMPDLGTFRSFSAFCSLVSFFLHLLFLLFLLLYNLCSIIFLLPSQLSACQPRHKDFQPSPPPVPPLPLLPPLNLGSSSTFSGRGF